VPAETAREAIDRLLASYALLYDSGDAAGCADLFVDDCEFLVTGRKPIQGRDALQRYFEAVHAAGAAGIHLVGLARVDMSPDGTSATIWQGYYFVANRSNTVVRGMYRDVAEHDGDRWRFRRRDVELYPGPD
jgi:uncharacterized protein (TIGR02246 family)